MRYQIEYYSAWRDKDWVELTQEIGAKDDADAVKKAIVFIRKKNKNKRSSLEEHGLMNVKRITRRLAEGVLKEKTLRIPKATLRKLISEATV